MKQKRNHRGQVTPEDREKYNEAVERYDAFMLKLKKLKKSFVEETSD